MKPKSKISLSYQDKDRIGLRSPHIALEKLPRSAFSFYETLRVSITTSSHLWAVSEALKNAIDSWTRNVHFSRSVLNGQRSIFRTLPWAGDFAKEVAVELLAEHSRSTHDKKLSQNRQV